MPSRLPPPHPPRSDVTKRELYFSYVRGWRNGAGVEFVDAAFAEHTTRPDIKAAYLEGFTDGQKARKAAGKAATRVYGYRPTILRAMAPPETSE